MAHQAGGPAGASVEITASVDEGVARWALHSTQPHARSNYQQHSRMPLLVTAKGDLQASVVDSGRTVGIVMPAIWLAHSSMNMGVDV